MRSRARSLRFSFLIADALVAFVAAGAFAQAPSTLAGVVHDSAGRPIADAEVILRDAGRAARTNARGQFALEAPVAGSYAVWIRRLGFRSVDYTWRALDGQRTDISVGLFPVPRELDPVVVRATRTNAPGRARRFSGWYSTRRVRPFPKPTFRSSGRTSPGRRARTADFSSSRSPSALTCCA